MSYNNYEDDRTFQSSCQTTGIAWDRSIRAEEQDHSVTKLNATMTGELPIIYPTCGNKYRFGDKDMTALELLVQINKNFQGVCIPPDALIISGKLYLKKADCCDVGKCIGTVINFIKPARKSNCDCHSLVGELWVLIALVDRQILLHSRDTVDGSCSSFEIRERCNAVHLCTGTDSSQGVLVTHTVSGPVEVVSACGKFKGFTGCGNVNGYLGFDGEFSNCKFWKQLANRCNVPDCDQDYTPESFPVTFNYEICLERNCNF